MKSECHRVWVLLAAVLSSVAIRAQDPVPASVPVPSDAPVPALGGGFPEGQATIGELLLHFDPEVSASLFPVYRDLAKGLDLRTRVVVAVGHRSRIPAARYVLEAAGFHPERIHTVVAEEMTVTAWARDRMVVVQKGAERSLLIPAREGIADDRRGDATVAYPLALRLPKTAPHEVGFSFEGGNLLFSNGEVLAGRSLLVENEGRGLEQDALEAEILDLSGDRLILVGNADALPHPHLDMMVTVVGPRQVLVAESSRAARYLRQLAALGLDQAHEPEFDRWTVQRQLHVATVLDDLADELREAGFEVHRIPIIVGELGGVISWNNALCERRRNERHAFVPRYGIPELDAEAAQVYESLGFIVHPVDVSRVASLGGTVRCLTNVLSWSHP